MGDPCARLTALLSYELGVWRQPHVRCVAAAPRQMVMDMTKIWGHRGAYHFAPENTLHSFQKAAEMGAGGIELDIQLTRDAQIVVIHDETIQRVSSGHGYVKDFTLSELRKFNFNKRGITKPLWMDIPTLEEALQLLEPTEITVNIEFKTGTIWYEGIEEKALKLAERFNMLNNIVWSSFNHYSVQKVKNFIPEARTALLCGGAVTSTASQCEVLGAEALHPHVRQLRYPGLVDDCHNRNIKVRPYPVDSPEDLRYAFSLGLDAVFTNRIDIATDIAISIAKEQLHCLN